MLMLQVLQEHVRARVQADDRRRLRSREGPHSRPPVPRPNVRSLRIALCIYRLPSTRTALLYSALLSTLLWRRASPSPSSSTCRVSSLDRSSFA